VLISVVYADGKHDMVKEFILTRLLEEKRIESFKRSDGWVDVRTGYLRGSGRPSGYDGPERRKELLEMEKMFEVQ